MDFNECGNGTINRTPTSLEEAKVAKENYYYWIRSEYNKLCLNDKKSLFASAMFIFLNKTCFRGVFRVGPKGFNVPYGHYHNPEIINKEHKQLFSVVNENNNKRYFFLDDVAVENVANMQDAAIDAITFPRYAANNTKVSVLTCDVGNELYSVFGHTAVRIQDDSKVSS